MDISRWLEQRVGAPLLMLHDRIYKGTNGRIGHTIPGGPSQLILHTTGAKTGQKRANSLSYARDGDDYLVVASKSGDPKAPGWYHNLKANPNVEINVGPKRFGVTAKPRNAGRPRLCAAVADRQQHEGQQKPLHRIPEADLAADSGGQADTLEQLFCSLAISTIAVRSRLLLQGNGIRVLTSLAGIRRFSTVLGHMR